MAAHDHLLRGRQCLNHGTKEAILEARLHFGRALELDSKFAAAWADMAKTYLYEYDSNWVEAPEDTLKHCFQCSQKAVECDDADSIGRYVLAWSYGLCRQFDMVLVHIDKALALNPNDYHSHCAKGYFLSLSGEFTEGISCANLGMRLNPFSPDACLLSVGIAEFGAKRYKSAIRAFGEGTSYNPLWRVAYLAACFAHLGREEQARANVRELVRTFQNGDGGATRAGPETLAWGEICTVPKTGSYRGLL